MARLGRLLGMVCSMGRRGHRVKKSGFGHATVFLHEHLTYFHYVVRGHDAIHSICLEFTMSHVGAVMLRSNHYVLACAAHVMLSHINVSSGLAAEASRGCIMPGAMCT